MKPRVLLSALVLAGLPLSSWAADCPELLQGQLTKLRSKEGIDLCQRYAGKPLIAVDTTSHCGFTPQFRGLEALYQRYKGQGLEVLGVPSSDFKQKAADTAETAEIYYGNYDVTFAMTQPQHMRGDEAIPLFRQLAEQSGQAPRWNFYKYMMDHQGGVVARFSSKTTPDDPQLQTAIEKAIASQP